MTIKSEKKQKSGHSTVLPMPASSLSFRVSQTPKKLKLEARFERVQNGGVKIVIKFWKSPKRFFPSRKHTGESRTWMLADCAETRVYRSLSCYAQHILIASRFDHGNHENSLFVKYWSTGVCHFRKPPKVAKFEILLTPFFYLFEKFS